MDVIALLEAKGIDYIDKGADEIAIVCPNAFNHHGGTDDNPSCNINVKKLVMHCLACGFKMAETGMTRWLMGDDLDEFQMGALKVKAALKRAQVEVDNDFCIDTEEFTMMPPSRPWTEDYRGISATTYEKLGARHCTVGRYADRIFFPIWQKGKLLGIDARALKGQTPKYLRPSGAQAKQWLYPYDYWAPRRPRYACIAEGIFHSIAGVEHGVPIFSIFGIHNYDPGKLLLLIEMGLDEVIFFGDADVAGVKARNTICPQLAEWLPTFYIPEDTLPEGKDAGDLTKEEMDYCLTQKVRFR